MAVSKICEVGNHPFTLEEGDIAAYKKFGFEPLPVCFPHQHQWRLAFRNDRFLHKRKCDLTGAAMIALYPQDSPFKVYEHETWFSDKWDPLSYGRPFDFNRPFFEQYADLQKAVPRLSLTNVGSVNSEYCSQCVFNKNCYLIFGGDRNEDSIYGALPMHCRSCVDCDWTNSCELCYFSTYSRNCYNCQFIFTSKNCSDCAFVENSVGCHDCMLSCDLQNKSYYIENKPYSKEEYAKKKTELLNGGYKTQQELWWKFLELRKKRIVKYANMIGSENCSGDLIFHSKNCRNCSECTSSEDCRECWTIFESKDCFNSDYIGSNSTLNFNNIGCDTAYRTWFSFFTISSNDIEYCELTNYAKNLFGCIAVRHKEFCILNKQYSKEEFIKLRGQIMEHMKKTGEWGRFFPKSLSVFPYNNSTASVFFPLNKEEVLKSGLRWQDEDTKPVQQTFQIPDNIRDVTDAILNEALVCEVTKKTFRVIPQELAFYRTHGIPVPRRHPDQRYRDRLDLRNPWQLWDRDCKKCRTPLKTSYAPERTEVVYCEKCYLKTIF